MSQSTHTHRSTSVLTRAKGAIAAASGAALLLVGGGTLALWTDSQSVDGGTIQSGHLAVGPIVEEGWYQEHETGRKPVNLNEYRMVPGDQIINEYPLDLALEGDNLYGELKFNFTAEGDLLANYENESGLELTYTVYWNGESLVDVLDIPIDHRSSVFLKSEQNPADGPLIPVPAALDGEQDLSVVVKATFLYDTPDTQHVLETLQYGGMDVTLEQRTSAQVPS